VALLGRTCRRSRSGEGPPSGPPHRGPRRPPGSPSSSPPATTYASARRPCFWRCAPPAKRPGPRTLWWPGPGAAPTGPRRPGHRGGGSPPAAPVPPDAPWSSPGPATATTDRPHRRRGSGSDVRTPGTARIVVSRAAPAPPAPAGQGSRTRIARPPRRRARSPTASSLGCSRARRAPLVVPRLRLLGKLAGRGVLSVRDVCPRTRVSRDDAGHGRRAAPERATLVRPERQGTDDEPAAAQRLPQRERPLHPNAPDYGTVRRASCSIGKSEIVC
jgi:hypothetical protein